MMLLNDVIKMAS